MQQEIKIHKKNTIRLKDLMPGQIAVSDKGRVFTRIWVPNSKEREQLVIELTDLDSQYFDHINEDWIVRILDQPGEGISIINVG